MYHALAECDKYMKCTEVHRGANGDMAIFAPKFIRGRLSGFNKDIQICLTPIQSTDRSGKTHAYFPALASCCGTLEYLTALFRGNTNRIGWEQVAEFAERYLPQPAYDNETIRILISAFRHPIAHRGIASGIWIDHKNGAGKGRRLTWKVSADTKRPACEILEEAGTLLMDPPWPSTYTHRVHIHLRGLWIDLRRAAIRYAKDIATDAVLQANFEKCMKQLYPM